MKKSSYINIFKFFLFIFLFLLTSTYIYAQMYSSKDSIGAKRQKYKIFTCKSKDKRNKISSISYIFEENRSDISLGCYVYKIDNGIKSVMNYFAVAAYTKSPNGRMDYNCILPYLSIYQAGERTILSFECPLIVTNPDKITEKILETKNIYGIINEKSIQITNH